MIRAYLDERSGLPSPAWLLLGGDAASVNLSMAENGVLVFEPRQITGKKVAQLRRRGIVPANIFGRGLASVSVQAPLKELRQAFRERGRNAIVEAQVRGEDGTRALLLREVQRHPVTDEVQHVEFYQVDLARRVHAQVEVAISGDSEAVHNGGVLVHSLATIEVEALPNEIPERFEVDISVLTNFGDAIHVSDLPVPSGIRILTDASAVVAAAEAPRVQEEEEEAALEEGEGIEGVEGEEGAVEGESAAEGATAVGGEPASS